MPTAAMSGNPTRSALEEKIRKSENEMRKTYMEEVSLSIVMIPYPTNIIHHANQMTGLHLPVFEVTNPAMVENRAPPKEKGIIRIPAPVAEAPKIW